MSNLSSLERSDQTVTRDLLCQLTQDEVRVKGEEFARLSQTIDAKEEERKQASKKAKDEIDELKTAAYTVRHSVRTHTEYRPVECVWYTDYTADEIVLVRTDTHQEVERQPMPDDWRQTRFL